MYCLFEKGLGIRSPLTPGVPHLFGEIKTVFKKNFMKTRLNASECVGGTCAWGESAWLMVLDGPAPAGATLGRSSGLKPSRECGSIGVS